MNDFSIYEDVEQQAKRAKRGIIVCLIALVLVLGLLVVMSK